MNVRRRKDRSVDWEKEDSEHKRWRTMKEEVGSLMTGRGERRKRRKEIEWTRTLEWWEGRVKTIERDRGITIIPLCMYSTHM